jgi:hypothetical protein
VVVPRSGQAQEGAVETRLAGDQLHAEYVGIEAQRAVEIGNEEHGVVQANR